MHENHDIEIIRKIIMINIMTIIALIILIPLGIVDLIQGSSTIGFFVLIVAAVLIFNQLRLRKSRNYIYTIYCGIFIIAAYFFYALVTGGVNNTGYLWYFTFPLFTLFLLGTKRGSVATLILLLLSVLFFAIDTIPPFLTTYTTDFKIRFVVSFLVVFTYSYLFEALREKARLRLSLRNTELTEIVIELEEKEDELRKAQDQLEERVEERTAEIVKANQELQAEINERRRAEDALGESEEKYRTILESIEDGYFDVDIAGNFTFFNDALCKIFGLTEEELIGKNFQEFADQETNKKGYKTFNKIYTTGKPVKGFDWEIKRKDGSNSYIEASVYLRKDSEGQPIGFQGVIRDITEKKLTEEEKKKLEEQLQRAQKMEAIGALAGGVAHDLNNILSGLVSYPELLLIDLPEESPLRKPFVTIQRSGQKAAAIVQDLLTLARRAVMATEVTNLNQIVASYLRSPELERLKEFHPNVTITSDLEIHLLNIMGSPVHLSKTVMNLVTNAAEAMPKGGTIFIATHNKYIDSPIRGYDDIKEGDYAILTVSDTGIGISSEDIQRIFEPFYTKKVMGRSGTGLGMAVVWGTVKDHKGHIDIQSTPGQGTTITLYFPVTRKEIRGQEEALPIEEYMGKGASIVVVDDVEEQREIASRILKKLGYAVTAVASGEEAVEYMKNNSADLLVLDMIMDPGIDGLTTYRKILELHPAQKAIIASGFSETERVKEVQRLGAGTYVKKPYTMEKIGLAVKEELEK